MTKTELSTLEALQALVESMLDHEVGEITRETTLREDLQLDSMNMIWLAFAIEKEFGVELQDIKINLFVTVGDVLGWIEKLQTEKL